LFPNFYNILKIVKDGRLMKDIEQEFIEHLAASVRGLGLDIPSSRLFGIIYVEPGEISIEELAKKSGYSLASVSIKARILERIGLIERRKHPGTKKVYCYREKNMITFIKRKANEIFKHEIIPAKNALPELIRKAEKRGRSEKEQRQVKMLKNYLRQMESVEKVFRKLNSDMELLEKKETKRLKK
jgi:DNA-binding transcriptional regulator GbsR (MarR family)